MLSTIAIGGMLSIATSFNAFAQIPATLWAVTAYGAGGKNIGFGSQQNSLAPTSTMRVDSAGNVVVVGSTSPFASGTSIITLKLDAAGNELWRAIVEGGVSGDDDPCCVGLGAAGSVYVLGTQRISSGSPSVLLVNYDSTGQEQWRSTAVAGTAARAIAVDSNGDAYLAADASGGGYAVSKVSATGSLLWTATIAGTNGDRPVAIAVDAFGQPHVTGYASNGTDLDYLTVKIGSAGTELWRALMNTGSGKDDSAIAMALDASSNVYVTGQGGAGFASDFVTVKYSAGGSEVWRKTLNSPGGSFDTARSIGLDGAGNVYVAGSGQNTAMNDDFITVKYDSAGNEKWRTLADSASGIHDEGFALAVDTGGNAYVTGFGSDHLGGTNRGMTVKYNANGGEVWRLPLSDIGSSADAGKAVAIDSAGNVYVGGFATRAGHTSPSLTLVKYSQSGVVVPYPPIITSALVTSGSVQLQFQPPVSNGGAPITQFVATCGALPPVSGPTSPLTVTGLVLGVTYPCVVKATNSAGTSAPSIASQVRWITVPDAPAGLQAVGGSGYARLGFAAPSSNGGAAIVNYTATCNPGAVTGSGSGTSLFVFGLNNGQNYSCYVVATNAAGDSAPSPVVSITPGDFALTAVKSRKSHGTAGTFDLDVDPVGNLDGALTVEPRLLGSGHNVIFHFNGPVTAGGTASVVDAAGQPIGTFLQDTQGFEVIVTIRDVPENQRARIQLAGVNGMLNVSVDIAFLFGNLRSALNTVGENFHTDDAASASTAATDISVLKSVLASQGSQGTSASNFFLDVNADGVVDARDLTAIRLRSGQKLR